MRHAMQLAFAVLLSGCGGGGGGSSENWLTIEPSLAAATSYAGEYAAVELTGSANPEVKENLRFAIISDAPVIFPDVQVERVSATKYRAKLVVSRDLKPGVHAGNFQLRACRDDPVRCDSPYAGSPWIVPYRFTILPTTDLRPLTPLPHAPVWMTPGGNAARTGYVEANLKSEDFSMRFKWAVPNLFIDARSLVTGGGTVMLSNSNPSGPDDIYAINERDGALAWQRASPDRGDVNLLMTGDLVYLLAGDIFAYERSGEPRWRNSGQVLGTTQIVHKGKIYSGVMNGIACYDAITGKQDWVIKLKNDTFQFRLAAFGDRVYAHAGSELWVIAPSDGLIVSKTTLSNWPLYNAAAPVLDEDGAVFVTSYLDLEYNEFFGHATGQLARLDPNRLEPVWSISGKFTSAPALAHGTLYVANGHTLEARSAQTGVLLWSWTSPSGNLGTSPLTSIIVVGKHAFVSRHDMTYAVDLVAKQMVWSYAASGKMAVSESGVLYIAQTGGSLVAFNLR